MAAIDLAPRAEPVRKRQAQDLAWRDGPVAAAERLTWDNFGTVSENHALLASAYAASRGSAIPYLTESLGRTGPTVESALEGKSAFEIDEQRDRVGAALRRHHAIIETLSRGHKGVDLQLSKKQLRQIERARARRAQATDPAARFDRFQLLSQWRGHVLEVARSDFEATLTSRGVTGPDRQYLMRIPLGLVRAVDRELVEDGAQIIYCIGRFSRDGRVTVGSLVWVRRMAPQTQSAEDLLHAGERLAAEISWSG